MAPCSGISFENIIGGSNIARMCALVPLALRPSATVHLCCVGGCTVVTQRRTQVDGQIRQPGTVIGTEIRGEGTLHVLLTCSLMKSAEPDSSTKCGQATAHSRKQLSILVGSLQEVYQQCVQRSCKAHIDMRQIAMSSFDQYSCPFLSGSWAYLPLQSPPS
jgi:hypothetical protein